jgi:hypothetical protein
MRDICPFLRVGSTMRRAEAPPSDELKCWDRMDSRDE